MDASVLNYTVNDNVGKFLKQTQKNYSPELIQPNTHETFSLNKEMNNLGFAILKFHSIKRNFPLDFEELR